MIDEIVLLRLQALAILGTYGAVRGVAQPGSASVWGTEGRRFKSGRSDHFSDRIHIVFGLSNSKRIVLKRETRQITSEA